MKKIPERIGSKYKFITVAAQRCDQLQKGATPLVDDIEYTKFTTLAMTEVVDDLIDYEDSNGMSLGANSTRGAEVETSETAEEATPEESAAEEAAE